MYFLFLFTFTCLMIRDFAKKLIILFFPVVAYSQPQAQFTYTQVCDGTPVHFLDLSTDTPPDTIISRNWNFGNGTTANGYLEEGFDWLYSTYGIYSVRLVVTTVSGLRDTLIQQVEIAPYPSASISVSPFTGCQPLIVSFTNNSSIATGNISNWLWDFDDGSTSTQQNPPSHTFWELFGHTVKLVVTSNKGCVDSTNRDIFVLQNPVCDFTASLVSLNDSSPVVNFTNLSSGGNIDLLWDFGDSTSSTEYSLIHTYDTCGAYNVILTATGTNTCVTVANYILEVCDTLVQIYNGVGEEQQNSLKDFIIYPNPSSAENLTISFEIDKEETISCFVADISGRLVATPFMKKKKQKGKHSFELKENFTTGIYFVMLNISGRMYSNKFVITDK